MALSTPLDFKSAGWNKVFFAFLLQMALGRFPYPTVSTIIIIIIIIIFIYSVLLQLLLFYSFFLSSVLISHFAEARNCFNVLVYH